MNKDLNFVSVFSTSVMTSIWWKNDVRGKNDARD